MPRPDRLLDLVRALRDGRLHRAEDLARRFGVSQRTIYRDLDTLIASGVPVAGERGLGYKAVAAVTLPPLNLTAEEADALGGALALLGDAPAARSLRAKLEAALPEGGGLGGGLAVGAFASAARGFRHVATVRAAVRARQKLRVEPGGRVVRPLALDYWGRVWTLTAWDEDANGGAGGFDALRLDALEAAAPLPQLFADEPGRTLADYRGA